MYTVRRKCDICEPYITPICSLITLLFQTELASLIIVQPIFLSTSASIRFTSAEINTTRRWMPERNLKEHLWYFCVLHARFTSLTFVLHRLIFRKILETEKCAECVFLSVFAKFRKATSASSYLSVPLSVCVGQTSSHRTDFLEILRLRIFRKSVEKICFGKIRKE